MWTWSPFSVIFSTFRVASLFFHKQNVAKKEDVCIFCWFWCCFRMILWKISLDKTFFRKLKIDVLHFIKSRFIRKFHEIHDENFHRHNQETNLHKTWKSEKVPHKWTKTSLFKKKTLTFENKITKRVQTRDFPCTSPFGHWLQTEFYRSGGVV